MTFAFPFLSRYRSAIIAVTAIAAGCTIFYVQTASSPSSSASITSTSHHAGLQRSNAQRGRGRRRRGDRLSIETDSHSGEGDETDRQWAEADDPDVRNHPVMSARIPPLTEPRAEEDQTTEIEITSEDSLDVRSPTEDKNRLHLLYRIAEEQSIKEGYIHRGIDCNDCGQRPIRGIRFRCVNCFDHDLCERCEANEEHHRTHVFMKIRIPIPLLGSPRQDPLPVFYPGQPTKPRDTQRLSFSMVTQYAKETNFTHSEVEALWEQFDCLASPPLLKTPLVDDNDLGIRRHTFDKCFVPPGQVRSAASNLIYDRMFDFYDVDGDDKISFSEFLSGVACLTKNSKMEERVRRAFVGYDIDQKGWVDREDFVRMFRAYYALNKELTKEMVAGWRDEDTVDEEVPAGSQPISSAFTHRLAYDQDSRAGEGKRLGENGDYLLVEGGCFLHKAPEDYEDDDFGREVIYQATQEALDELLDPLFPDGHDQITYDEFQKVYFGPAGPTMKVLIAWLDMAIF